MSKPFDFLKTIQSYIEQNDLCSDSDRLLLAVSGGVDSVVMAIVLHALRYDIGLCHINFKLRGHESDEDAEFVRQLSTQLNAPAYIYSADAQQYGTAHNLSIQEAAREIRYDYFQKIAGDHSFDMICTAHHIDDQMETILFRLFKGAGLKGLLGIPAQNRSIIRPLLCVTKAQIVDYASQHNIQYREDSTNATLKYQRNFIRHHIMPHISAVNPSWPQTLQQQIRIWQSTYDFYSYSTDQYWSARYQRKYALLHYYNVEDLISTPGHLSALYALLSQYDFNTLQCEAILNDIKADKSGTLYLSTTFELLLYRRYLIIRSATQQTSLPTITWSTKEKEHVEISHHTHFQLADVPSCKYHSLPIPHSGGPYTIRSWQEGDTFHPDGMRGRRKKLSDFFTDAHVDRFARDLTAIVCDANNNIIWIPGLRYDDKYINEAKIRGYNKFIIYNGDNVTH